MEPRTCRTPGCGEPIPPTTRGRPRQKCERCAPRKLRVADPETGQVSYMRPTSAAEFGVKPEPTTVLAATRAALEAAGRMSHWAGQAALLVAARIDATQVEGSPLASMIKAHRDSMKAALGEAAESGDELDAVFSRTS